MRLWLGLLLGCFCSMRRALRGPKLFARHGPLRRLFATYEECGPVGVKRCAELLRVGGLVAFPTETVYGLGADALNSTSVAAIFTAKQRPVTDPLIVHVLDKGALNELFDFSGPGGARGREVCEALCDAFWPGPLTIIYKASARVPSLVTASTGFVGLRSPKHSVARALLAASGVPVAAPSANRFGHVSPTTPEHVYADLQHASGLLILRDDAAQTGGCSVGIESTVCRVSADGTLVTVLRCGAVTSSDIAAVVAPAKVVIENSKLVSATAAGAASSSPIGAAAEGEKEKEKEQGLQEAEARAEAGAEAGAVAPGQMIKHYAPDVPTFIYCPTQGACVPGLAVSSSLVMDFGGVMLHLRERAAAYEDLSPTGAAPEAFRRVFASLRAAEERALAPGSAVKSLLLPDLRARARESEEVRALWERLNRAASGVYTQVP